MAALIMVLVLALALAGGAVYLTYQINRTDTVYPGVSALGIDFSGMTRQQVTDALMAKGAERYQNLSVTASLPLNNTLTVTSGEAGMTWNGDRLAQEIWSYGRSGRTVEDSLTYIRSMYLHRTDFTPTADIEVSLDESAVRAIVAKAADDINAQLLSSAVEVTDTEIRLLKGASSLVLDRDAVTDQVIRALVAGTGEPFTYESAPQTDDSYDFGALHDEMYAEMVNARLVYAPEYAQEYAANANAQPTVITRPNGEPKTIKVVHPALTDPQPGDEALDFQGQPFLVTESQVGVDFDVAEAERLWAAAGYGETVTVPITITEPELSTQQINDTLFADPLSKNWTMVKLWNRDYCNEVRTSLAGSSNNRIANVKKACDLIDGIMLMPGETFSYNPALGERTEENGWLPAPAYANGEVRQEAGGGICQVSSTLYNAALYANLEIVDRTCHQFQVGYLPWGMDATVSWGWPEFKFRNDQDYPIKIHAWVDEATNECCVQILGTDVDHVYVIMRFYNWEVFDTTDTYHDADGNSLAVGMQASTWREVYHDGEDWATTNPISDTYESFSSYIYHTEDIEARNVPKPAA